METQTNKFHKDVGSEIERRIGAIAWALFFIWVGVSFLAELSIGIGLLGVGIISLGGQAARSYYNLKIEWFWLVLGSIFVLGGFWEYVEPGIPFVPFLLILAGIALLYSILRKSMSGNKQKK